MKKLNLIYLLCTLFFLHACGNKSEETEGNVIQGKLNNAFASVVFLDELSPEGIVPIDTALIKENGEFKFKKHVDEMGFYRIGISNDNFATLIIGPDQNIVLNADARKIASTYKVEGSPDTELFIDINEASQLSYYKLDSLTRVFQAFVNTHQMNQYKIDSLSSVIEPIYTQFEERHKEYLVQTINENPSSLACIAAIQQLDENKHFKAFEALYNGLIQSYPNSKYTKRFAEDFERKQKLQIGNPAPDIALNNPKDETVRMSEVKADLLLLDFWASWCAPCRAENPNLVKTYKEFHPKGFEIYGVSLDKNKEPWLQAIEKDGLSWMHVSDLKAWQSEAAVAYAIRSIPSNCLIDVSGNIVGKNLRGEELRSKICELKPEWCKQ